MRKKFEKKMAVVMTMTMMMFMNTKFTKSLTLNRISHKTFKFTCPRPFRNPLYGFGFCRDCLSPGGRAVHRQHQHQCFFG